MGRTAAPGHKLTGMLLAQVLDLLELDANTVLIVMRPEPISSVHCDTPNDWPKREKALGKLKSTVTNADFRYRRGDGLYRQLDGAPYVSARSAPVGRTRL